MTKKQGFTLIEIIIVIIIISVVLSFVTLSIGKSGQLKQEVQRLTSLLQLASQEAVMQAKEMGISFDDNTYQFYVLENKTWNVITASDNIFRPRKLPLNIDVEIFLEGDSIQKNSDLPQLLILSSGEFTPFEIILTHKNIYYKISGNIMGEITVETN